MLRVDGLQCLGKVFVTGTVRGIGLNGGGYLVISLRLRPSNSVDKVMCSLAGSCVCHGCARVGVDGVQLLLLLELVLMLLVQLRLNRCVM